MLAGHRDRILTAAVSPDGCWALSAARDRGVRLWDLRDRQTIETTRLNAEPRACFFLPDGETAGIVDKEGQVRLYSVPGLELQVQLESDLGTQCGELAPAGDQLVVGCADGQARFIDIDGLEEAPLLTTALPAGTEKPSVFGRLLGKVERTPIFSCKCPACRRPFDLRGVLPEQPANCPCCHRALRFRTAVRV